MDAASDDAPRLPTETPPAPRGGRLSIVLAAVLWSTSGLFTKTTLFDDWPLADRGLLMAFWRALFAGLLLLPFIRRPRLSIWLLPLAGCFIVMSVTYLSAVTMNTAGNAIWLQHTAPMWVFLFAVVIGRTRFDRRNLVPLVCAAAGVGTILFCELNRDDAAALSRWGVANGLAAGASYAGVVLCMRRLRNEDPLWLVAFAHLAVVAALLPPVVMLGHRPAGVQWLMMAGFGVFQMGVPYLLFVRGLRTVAAQEASLIVLLEPVLVPLWLLAVLENHETSWWTFAGGGLILAGLALRYLRPPLAARREESLTPPRIEA